MSINHSMIIPKDNHPLDEKTLNDPLGRPSLSMIVGSTGSGKTVLLLNLMSALEDRHEFESGLLVSGNLKDPTLMAVELPKTSSPVVLADYLTKLSQAEKATNHLLIFDDVQGSPDLNLMANRSMMINFLLSHRHIGEDPDYKDRHGTWVLATCQTLKNSFTPQIRNNVKNFFLYYPNRNPKQLADFEDLAMDKSHMKKAMAILKESNDPHNFIFLNKWNPREDKYFLNFDKELKFDK